MLPVGLQVHVEEMLVVVVVVVDDLLFLTALTVFPTWFYAFTPHDSPHPPKHQATRPQNKKYKK